MNKRKITELREASGMSREEAAQKAGISISMWSQLENGERKGTKTLAKAAKLLGVPVEDLMGSGAPTKQQIKVVREEAKPPRTERLIPLTIVEEKREPVEPTEITLVTEEPEPREPEAQDDALSALDSYPMVMTPSEVQEVLRISRATFFRLIGENKIPGAVRIGGSWRVIRDYLKAWPSSEAPR